MIETTSKIKSLLTKNFEAHFNLQLATIVKKESLNRWNILEDNEHNFQNNI